MEQPKTGWAGVEGERVRRAGMKEGRMGASSQRQAAEAPIEPVGGPQRWKTQMPGMLVICHDARPRGAIHA